MSIVGQAFLLMAHSPQALRGHDGHDLTVEQNVEEIQTQFANMLRRTHSMNNAI